MPDRPWRPVADEDHRTKCRSYDGFFRCLVRGRHPEFLSAYLVRPFGFGQLGTPGLRPGWLWSSTRLRSTLASHSAAPHSQLMRR
jgi:hypothetical protein